MNKKIVGTATKCRFCKTPLSRVFVDLGMSPLCQTQISPEQLNHMEPFYPLCVYVCDNCFLVQLDEYVAPAEIFSNEYPYFSSFSDSWVAHAKQYCDVMTDRLSLDGSSLVMEIASNDGYLLQHFVDRGIDVLGIEPTANTASAAIDKGVRTDVSFFGLETAKQIAHKYGKPDLLLGNNVLAHVPDIVDFVSGMKALLKPSGAITMEFPHLLNLIDKNQFDTIYHEHFSYLSLFTVRQIFESTGLTIFDVEEISTHGGSLRIFARHEENGELEISSRVGNLLKKEADFGLQDFALYESYGERVKETKRQILDFLIEQNRAGKSVVGYGAPGKGNTLLNYCGIRTDFLQYTVDRSPHKYGTYTPGTHIPILHPDEIQRTKPDYIFVLPWNLINEIIGQTSFAREWGASWVIPIPELKIIS
ncbi:MAG: class I SAM-dependent methyltransferase [Woeseiaceae bacterium]